MTTKRQRTQTKEARREYNRAVHAAQRAADPGAAQAAALDQLKRRFDTIYGVNLSGLPGSPDGSVSDQSGSAGTPGRGQARDSA